MERLRVSERLARRILWQHRFDAAKAANGPNQRSGVRADVVAIATLYGRYGYRRIKALAHAAPVSGRQA